MEKKIARLEDQLRKATDDSKSKDGQLRMYKQWQTMENAIAPG
jgi:hypothetical protein